MKRAIMILMISMAANLAPVLAQNNSFRYQALIQDVDGKALANRRVSFLISIIKTNGERQRVYSEYHAATTDDFGSVALGIGQGSATLNSFQAINWAGNSFDLKVELDENGGTNFRLLTESPLMAVPYALHAQSVTNNDDADADPQNELQQLQIEGNLLTLTQGNSIVIPQQTLTIDGNTLSISNGNTVTLPSGNLPSDNPDLPTPVIYQGRQLYVYPEDNGLTVVFGAPGITGASSLTDGETNTQRIVTTYGSGIYAAKICSDLEAFGYDDWYLPSRAELDAIYKQNYLLFNTTIDQYWTSTESKNNKAFVSDQATGVFLEETKNMQFRCRCVRKN